MIKHSKEESLAEAFVQMLDDKIEEEAQLVLGSLLPHLDYAEHVGYVRAVRDIRADFVSLISAFYPT